MTGTHILLVDDDALLRRSLALNLEDAGYRVSTAASGEEAIEIALREPPDLVLLDIGLPGIDGLDALRHLRARLDVPVIFLTARRRELDEILGLELGADDYIAKPFDHDVLLAHIKAVLRRSQPEARGWPAALRAPGTEPLVVGDLEVDPGARTVTLRGRPVDLPRLEFDLLHTLAQQPGQVLSVDELLARVWGPEYVGEPQAVYVHIRWLRTRIEDDPQRPARIVTVRGVGYKLEPVEA